jgi:hypothetical protein
MTALILKHVSTRREFLAAGAGLLAGTITTDLMAEEGGSSSQAAGPTGLVKGVERSIIWNGRSAGATWFHPRACMIPGRKPPEAFMTLQPISGSDVFGPVHWSTSADLGKTWTQPKEIPGLGRKPARGGREVGVCDVVPEYHPKTSTVLAIGHNVYYRKNVLADPQYERYPIYVVRSPVGVFSAPARLEWDDPRSTQIYTCGCAQRVTLENGDLLIPLSFAPKGRTPRSVSSVLCAFDGRTAAIKACGNELKSSTGRGLLEPSMVRFAGRFYLTIRAEDSHGYVASSADGLNWERQQAWCWDDGEPITTSTTQQHWLAHSNALFLVYTRRTGENADVGRWRAPLYMAQVDMKTLRLIRETEQVIFPMIGDAAKAPKRVARMGNFHTTAATPEESWVTVGEECPEDGWKGNTLLARIRWVVPNRLV